MIARVDGRPADSVSLRDRGLLHGDAVYELVRVTAGRPFLLEWHRERLEAGLAAFRFGDASAIWDEVAALLLDVGPRDGVLRILVTRGDGGVRAPLSTLTPRRIVTFEEGSPPTPRAPLRATIVSRPRVTPELPSANAKYARYLPYLLAADDARARGFDEALLLDANGGVAEAATANVFAVQGGALVTPPLTTGVLAGITRRWIVEQAPALGLRVEEAPLSLSTLRGATEVLLTSSIRGIASLDALDDIAYQPSTPVADSLRAVLHTVRAEARRP